MNEEQTQQIVAQVSGWLQQGEQLVQDQMPILCQEIIFYGRIQSALWLLVTSVILFLGINSARILIKDNYADKFHGPISLMGLLVGGFFLIVWLLAGTAVWFAPRLFVLGQLRSLI